MLKSAILDDLSRVRVTGKRLWARIADPSTGKRRLCSTSKEFPVLLATVVPASTILQAA